MIRDVIVQRDAPNSNYRPNDVFVDEYGFTTVGIVLALLITLSLIFTTAQVYRINSAAAEVQDVADAAALAAQNQVAEYMLVVRTCDAVVLSLSLTGIACCGLGVVALCVPAAAPLSSELLSASKAILAARDQFSSRATDVLTKLQEALPFYAALCAAGVAAENNGGAFEQNYIAVAIMLPATGEVVGGSEGDSSNELIEDIEEQSDEIRQKAEEAQEAAEEANRAKERAFARDCGDNPSYCMYERADHLAGLSSSDNPLYASVDDWSFSVPLERARKYYAVRLANEAPADDSLDEQMRSALRTRFYRYAVNELEQGYVVETDDHFEAYFPRFPSNTQEMRMTSLYTEEVYPVTEGENGKIVVHGWTGCPEAAESLERCSIQYMEQVEHDVCPVCGFTAASMGSVAAASTSIENGFEYHYEAVADEAFLYEKARREADEPSEEVKERVNELLDQLEDVARSAAGKRIDMNPPGRYGSIAFVVNVASSSAAGPFSSAFVASDYALGPRAAIAAATLVDEGSEDGRSAISSLLDGMAGDVGSARGVAGMVLSCWSWVLSAYAYGQEALLGAIEDGLNALPLVGASGLGTWAAEKLRSTIEDIGLEPAEIGALKPVIVNSAHVASKDSGEIAQGLLSVKQIAIAHPSASTDLFSSILAGAEQEAVSQIESFEDTLEIAQIDLGGPGGEVISLSIPIPPSAREVSIEMVHELFARLRSYYIDESGVRVWE